MIGIINYGMGNLRSIQKACEIIGGDAQLVNSPLELPKFDLFILPGVGHFGNAMDKIKRDNWDKAIVDSVLGERKKILGICLGMQLLTQSSEEAGGIEGLGLISANTFKFKKSKLKIPHIGWNTLEFKKKPQISIGLDSNSIFYFVHSYFVKCLNPQDVLCETTYDITFDSGFEKENIFGLQFHPEKSHKSGIKLIKNILNI